MGECCPICLEEKFVRGWSILLCKVCTNGRLHLGCFDKYFMNCVDKGLSCIECPVCRTRYDMQKCVVVRSVGGGFWVKSVDSFLR